MSVFWHLKVTIKQDTHCGVLYYITIWCLEPASLCGWRCWFIYGQWRRKEFESGGTGPARKWGQRSGTKAGTKFSVVPLHIFGSKYTINRFGERFRDGQISLVSFFFAVFLLTVPPCPATCKSGGARAPVPHGVGATVRRCFPITSRLDLLCIVTNIYAL